MSAPPFRFLDLPAELRCMVYEALDVATRKEKYNPTRKHEPPYVQIEQDDSWPQGNGKLVMYRRALPMSILATCRLVNKEAAPIIAQKLQKMVKEPVRFRMNWKAANWVQNDPDSCLTNSPEQALAGARSSDSISRFVSTCNSYLAGVGLSRLVGTSTADVEATIASSELDYRSLGWSWALTCGFFEGLCQVYCVRSNGTFWKQHAGVDLRIDAIISPQPKKGFRLDNWRIVASTGQLSGHQSYVAHMLSKDDWEARVQMLKEL
ncbi:uncharacterized protein J4E88_006390 [Alternaria novae-zelandiae]|uniref:uncharacterized protein n=1 Tax=Alternaria novae-zelandiae TaxID=430562 RepID=UPI0020C58114|nr:uncharacterized protein J4E88_006390 [Alternaria novae-zelandiae]KAI4679097.1 hypothetical protein J4E88_006390 [Alternaria novae-zelandiae]